MGGNQEIEKDIVGTNMGGNHAFSIFKINSINVQWWRNGIV